MSLPFTQQPPPAVTINQQYYNAHSSHGSVGPVIAVLVVIIILGILAGMIGRLCSGKRIMGYGQYDVESWAERKFSSCIDGTLSPPLTRPHNVSDTSVSTPMPMPTPTPTPTHQEREQEEEQEQHSSSNQPTHNLDS